MANSGRLAVYESLSGQDYNRLLSGLLCRAASYHCMVDQEDLSRSSWAKDLGSSGASAESAMCCGSSGKFQIACVWLILPRAVACVRLM